MPAPVMSTLREAMRVSKAIEGRRCPSLCLPRRWPAAEWSGPEVSAASLGR